MQNFVNLTFLQKSHLCNTCICNAINLMQVRAAPLSPGRLAQKQRNVVGLNPRPVPRPTNEPEEVEFESEESSSETESAPEQSSDGEDDDAGSEDTTGEQGSGIEGESDESE